MADNFAFQRPEYVVLRMWARALLNESHIGISPANPATIYLLPQYYEEELNGDWIELCDLYINPNVLLLAALYPNQSLHYGALSSNVDAIHIIEQHLDDACWEGLSANPAAIHILEANMDKLSAIDICSNTNALHLIKHVLDTEGLSYDDIENVSANPCAMPLLLDIMDVVDLCMFSKNPSAVSYLEAHPELIQWRELSANPNAIHILEQHLDNVCWDTLSANPNAIHILDNNLNKVDWEQLSANPSAIDLIEANLDKVNMFSMTRNPNIVTYDYDAISNDHHALHMELIAKMYHPVRISAWLDAGNELEDYMN